MRFGWSEDSARTLAWRAIKAAGEAGVSMRDLAATLGLAEKALGNAVYMLKRLRLVEQRYHGGPFFVTPRCGEPPVVTTLPQRALELVADCPAGLDAPVLAEELRIAPRHVRIVMAAHVAAGQVTALQVRDGRWLRYVPAQPAGEAAS